MTLLKDRGIALQIVATRSSLHFYSQESIDASIRMSPKTLVQNGHVKADGEAADVKAAEEIVDESVGVRVWTDADEWAVSNARLCDFRAERRTSIRIGRRLATPSYILRYSLFHSYCT